MLNFSHRPLGLCDGTTRREWLRAGSLGLAGLSLPELLRARAAAAPSSASRGSGAAFGQAKSVILFFLTGGPPHQETWDCKPQAPAEVRGEFRPIPSRVGGMEVSEMMPRTALLTDRIAVLRAMVTNDNAHSSSGYQMLTGVPHVPLNRESVTAKAPNLYPCVGSMLRALRTPDNGLPASIVVPEHIWNDGNIPWPGQDAGFLGRNRDPWLINCNPEQEDFRIPNLELAEDVSQQRFGQRRSLLEQLERRLAGFQQNAAVRQYTNETQQAVNLLSAPESRKAFDLGQEPASVRDRYGRSRFAQGVLLSRRLVEAGVPLVRINWVRIAGKANQGGWDTHSDHTASMKNLLMPMMDQCFSALVEDLDQRGLLDETLVVWMGEFGRTPRFNSRAGRDHWGKVFSVALAGGGIRGGVIHGASDAQAAFPSEGRVSPADLTATIFHCLGLHGDTQVYDTLSRPHAISRGQVIEQIF